VGKPVLPFRKNPEKSLIAAFPARGNLSAGEGSPLPPIAADYSTFPLVYATFWSSGALDSDKIASMTFGKVKHTFLSSSVFLKL